MLQKVLRSMQQVLELAMSMFTAVLQSMPSPLEVCACIAVVDGQKDYFQLALAVTTLSLQCAIGTCHETFYTTILFNRFAQSAGP